jgi:hypothetical protein
MDVREPAPDRFDWAGLMGSQQVKREKAGLQVKMGKMGKIS